MNFQFAALALNFMFDIFLYAVPLRVFTALLNRIFGKPGPYLKWIQGGLFPVSYTHLTLPTILRV